MAMLTVDLNDLADIQYGRSVLEQREANLSQGHALQVETPNAQDQAAFQETIRGLLATKTGRDLIAPFLREFQDAATIEQIAEIIDVEPGVDRVRKAHSLVAGLGRWETPRGIRVYESLGGRPQRFRMTPRVREAVERELARRNLSD